MDTPHEARWEQEKAERHERLLRTRQHATQALVSTMVAAGAAIGALLLGLRQEVETWFRVSLGIPLLIVGLTLVASGSALVYMYLRGWVPIRQRGPRVRRVTADAMPSALENAAEMASLSDRLDLLEQAPPPISIGASASDVAQVLLPSVQSDLVRIFEDRYERTSDRARSALANSHRFDAAVKRLEGEIKEQSRKGNVNLTIGLLTTVVAIALLVYMVVMAPSDLATMAQVASHYVPWISLVLFIEVFSFFFLRLYQKTLDEARRYHDDLSRLTLQWVAAETGRFAEEAGATSALAKELLGASRAPKAEVSSGHFDSDKALHALMVALAKQFGERAKDDSKS